MASRLFTPTLSFASPRPCQISCYKLLTDIAPIDGDHAKGSAVFVGCPARLRVATRKVNQSSRQDLVEFRLGDFAEPALGVALRMLYFRRIDISNSHGLAVQLDCPPSTTRHVRAFAAPAMDNAKVNAKKVRYMGILLFPR